MTEITLELDRQATKTLKDLMHHYNLSSRAELFTKAIAMLKIAAIVDQTNGELIARKGGKESKIDMR